MHPSIVMLNLFQHLKIKKQKVLLFSILLVGFLVRIYGQNWDGGHNQHPDERMIIMTAVNLHLPQPGQSYLLLQPESPLNPKFFAYGNLPVYLVRIVGQIAQSLAHQPWNQYDHLFSVGRTLSAFFDTGSILLIFLIGSTIFSPLISLISALVYATCVFPVQLSHFYAVDTVLNFFILLTLFQLLRFYQNPTLGKAAKVGLAFGLSLTTKISATVLIASVGTALVIDLILIFFKKYRQQFAPWWKRIFLIFRGLKPKQLIRKIGKEVILSAIVFAIATTIVFILVQPYALIDFPTFWRQINEQKQMTKNAAVFPYTLQYLGTPSYLYFLKNILFWGIGAGLGIVSLAGSCWYLFDLSRRLLKKGDYDHEAQEVIILIFFLVYFLTIGRFAVKFMRYLLPLYPFLILYGISFLYWLGKKVRPLLGKIAFGFFLSLHLLWLASFLQIYSRPHTRVTASNWIKLNIPLGSSLAVEHWDDHLPLFDGQNFQYLEMPLYENDFSPQKWQIVKENLQKADFLILASNRLYTPLQRLADCGRFKPCFPRTAKYYEDLFSGKLGFFKIAEFSSYPTLPLLNLPIPDDSADESFTVYDHPKVIIFQKKQGS